MEKENRKSIPGNLIISVTGVISSAIGLAVMAGWYAGSITLIKIAPSFIVMHFNTALGLFLSGTGLLAISLGIPRLTAALGGAVSLIGLLTFIQYIYGINLGIDQLLMKDYISANLSPYPGRMNTNTALNFSLVGISFLLIGRQARPRYRPLILGLLGSIIIAIATVALLGYITGVKVAYVSGHMVGMGMAVHTALGFTLIGISIGIFAWRDEKIEGGETRWLPAVVGIGALTATLILWQALTIKEGDHIKRTIQTAASSIGHEITWQIESRITSLVRMAKRWEVSGKPSKKEWETEADQYVSQISGYRSVQWVAPSFRERWTVYSKENDIHESPETAEERLWVMSDSARNGMRFFRYAEGFKVYVPISVGNDLAGFIVGTFNNKEAFGEILNDEVARRYTVVIYDGSGEIYRQNYVSGRSEEAWGEDKGINAYNMNWRMRVWPTPDLLDEMKTSMPEVALISGLLLTLLLTLSVYLAQKARSRAEEVEAARQTLQESEDRLKEAQQIAKVGNWDWDILNNELYWSDEVYRIFGLLPQQFAATYEAFMNSVHPDDRDLVNKSVSEALSEKKPYSIDHRIVLPDGTERTVYEQAVAVFDGAGKPVRMVGTVQDITERKKAEDLIKKQSQELARSNEELEKFAYVASHDLQEPLRTISSFTQLLARRHKGKLDSDADEFISYIVDGASRMQRLINDLLTYSRVGSRNKDLEAINCEEILDHVLDDLMEGIVESKAVVTRGPLPLILADPTQMEQLFRNLIGNAIKFRREEAPKVHISAEKRKNEWVFSVQDNGIGIEQDYFDRIFIVFQRLHGKTEYSGTGIGLAVCKKIVEGHGGRIWVESAKGKGSTFYFTIPVKGGN